MTELGKFVLLRCLTSALIFGACGFALALMAWFFEYDVFPSKSAIVLVFACVGVADILARPYKEHERAMKAFKDDIA